MAFLSSSFFPFRVDLENGNSKKSFPLMKTVNKTLIYMKTFPDCLSSHCEYVLILHDKLASLTVQENCEYYNPFMPCGP